MKQKEKQRDEGSRNWVRILLPFVVVAVAVGIVVLMIFTKPEPPKQPRTERPSLVTVESLELASEQVYIEASGSVVPARTIQLQPRVSGTLIAVSPEFEPGGRFKAGEELVQIDPVDYELVVAAREAELAKAQRAYKEELGYQEVARHEWELVDNRDVASELEKELTLRKPQLASAEATLKAAKASLRKAQLDLQRTAVKAPFDAVILEQRVDLGSQVSAQTVLADLACTEAYWVEVTLPVDLLQWVERARQEMAALPVEVYPSGGTVGGVGWTGTVIRRRADLEPNGRLARIIVEVENPLEQVAELPLMLGSYVQVQVQGPMVKDVFSLPRCAVHNGNEVWIMNDQQRLDIRTVDILWRDRNRVLVREGLKAGEKLVVTDLAAPVPGMKLMSDDVDPGGRECKKPGEEVSQ